MDATLKPVLTVGATGRIGSGVVDLLLEAEVPVRAVTRNRDSADLPGNVEVVEGDLAAPASLEKALQGVDTVFLVWTAPPATIPEAIDLLAAHAQRVVYLSAPHQTPHPFFQQPNPMAAMHAEVEQRIAASGLASTILRPGMLRPTPCPGGQPRSATRAWFGGPMARRRRHPSMTVIWLPSPPRLCFTMNTKAATTS